MSKEHIVKTLTKFFEPAAEGRKPFEVRINDRDYEVGDTLVQREWAPYGGFSGYETRSRITYVLDDPAYCRAGYVVLGLQGEAASRMTEIQDKDAEIIRQRARIDRLDSELHKQNCRNQDQAEKIERLRKLLTYCRGDFQQILRGTRETEAANIARAATIDIDATLKGADKS